MSEETPRSEDSAPSLSKYPPAFVSLIEMFMKRTEDAETRAHKALVILKQKDGLVTDLQQRLESLDKSPEQPPEMSLKQTQNSSELSLKQSEESQPDNISIPPLDLPQSSSSSSMGIWSPHPRQVEAQRSRIPEEDPSLETLYERTLSSHCTEESTESSDCYAKCKRLLQEEMPQPVNWRVENTQLPRVIEESDLEERNDQIKLNYSPDELSSSTKIDTPYMSNGSGDHYEMIIINRAAVKDSVDMAGSILNCIQQRLEDDSYKYPERNISNLSTRDARYSSKSSVSSYHTPKSNFSSRCFIRRRKTTTCFFNSLNRAHKKLKWKYHHVYNKFKESLALCGKLQDDIISLTERQAKNKEVQVSKTEKQIQTQVAMRSTTSLLQGRLDAASQAIKRRLSELQQLRTQLEDSQSMVAALKKRLCRVEADAAKKETQLTEAEATNAAQSSQLQQLKNRLAEMLKTKQAVEDREEIFRLELEETKQAMEDQEEMFRKELEETQTLTEAKVSDLQALLLKLDQKESKSVHAVEDLECRLKQLEEQLIFQIVEASERLTAADTKIQQLYLAIQTFLKMVFSMSRGPCFQNSDLDVHAMRVASEILQLQPAQLNSILQASTSVNKWLRRCRRLLFEEEFADKLGCLLAEAAFEARNSCI